MGWRVNFECNDQTWGWMAVKTLLSICSRQASCPQMNKTSRASVCARVCVGALTLVCHCHVFTQCYELQPWHRFHTPDMLLHPHSSASEESWNEPFLPPTQQPSNEKLRVLCVCVLSKMQQSKIYYVVRPKCLPSMENNKVISHTVAPFIL